MRQLGKKPSMDLSPCHQTGRRLWFVWTKACILTENWQHVPSTVHSHTSDMHCYSFPLCSSAIKVILFPFPPWSRAVSPFPIGLSCHNIDQTPQNCSSMFWEWRKAVPQSAWHRTAPYSFHLARPVEIWHKSFYMPTRHSKGEFKKNSVKICSLPEAACVAHIVIECRSSTCNKLEKCGFSFY